MKIQLDTDNKTIKIEQDVLLSKLITTLNALLPNKEWKKYTLQTNTVINNWNSPIVIKERYYSQPYYYSQPWITYCSNTYKDGGSILSSNRITENKQTAEYKVNSGLYNLEIK